MFGAFQVVITFDLEENHLNSSPAICFSSSLTLTGRKTGVSDSETSDSDQMKADSSPSSSVCKLHQLDVAVTKIKMMIPLIVSSLY